MGTYCTLEEMITVVPEQTIIELSDDSGEAITHDEDNVNAAIEQAGDDIDGYLRGSYELPLTTIPATIKNIALDLAVYNLWTRRPERDVPEVILRKYRDALAKLKDIQRGVFTLDIAMLNEDTLNGSLGVTNKTRYSRIFNHRKMRHEYGYSNSEYRRGNYF
jgi:phage gp36-like protein